MNGVREWKNCGSIRKARTYIFFEGEKKNTFVVVAVVGNE